MIDVTDDMMLFDSNPEIKKSMALLRARAMQKLGRNEDVRKILSEIGMN